MFPFITSNTPSPWYMVVPLAMCGVCTGKRTPSRGLLILPAIIYSFSSDLVMLGSILALHMMHILNTEHPRATRNGRRKAGGTRTIRTNRHRKQERTFLSALQLRNMTIPRSNYHLRKRYRKISVKSVQH